MQVGFLSLLTLVFVTGKVFGALTWSWWLVFSPLLIGIPVILFLAIVFAWVASTGK